MKELLKFLCCPNCKSNLKDVENGLVCRDCHVIFPIINGIPRFVGNDSVYSTIWSKDKEMKLKNGEQCSPLSQKIAMEKSKGKVIMDAGCGTGRHLEHFNDAKIIIGVDSSNSVDIAREHYKKEFGKNLFLVQADILRLPFKTNKFDLIISNGVLHHTSDAKKGFIELTKLLKIRGKIIIFLYSKYYVLNKRIERWRKILTPLNKKLLYYICAASLFFPLVPKITKGHFGKKRMTLRERTKILYDWYAPDYRTLHTYSEVYQWFKEAGIINYEPLDPPVTVKGTRELRSNE